MQRLRYHFRTLKLWKWILGSFVMLFVCVAIFIRLNLGELAELGMLRLTGFPGGQDYLIVFQNDAERRPTGGFITAYATLKFRLGIPLIAFGNVYDEKLIQKGTEHPDETVRELIGGPSYPGHGFRDGNFEADFTATAPELIRLYQLGYPDAEFDGVIAVNNQAVGNLIDALGGVQLGEQWITGGSLFHALESEIQDVDLHNPEEIANRKGILSHLAGALIRRAVTSPRVVTDSIAESLRGKQILFWFTDSDLQSIAKQKNWTGELPFAVDSDLLVVNEGNYGGMKSSRYIVRDIIYDVELTDTEEDGLAASADVKIAVEHRGDAAEPISGYYKSYWRVFAPWGSERDSGTVEREFDDGERQVFGKILQMNPGESREFLLNYSLPDFVLTDRQYKLKLIKQPGSATDHYRVTVKAPAGYLFESADFDTRENLAIFETNLKTDLELKLKIIPDTQPPRLAWQQFRGGISRIDLRWNESLDATSVEQASFALADLNYRNDQTDSISINSVRFIPPQNIEITASGIREECREWYSLTIDGVADAHGNTIKNKEITIVQSLNALGQLCDPERKL